MNVRSSYLAMIKAFPGGMDAMAAALGFTRDGLRNRIYETRGQRLHVETAMEMQELSDTDYFAEAVAISRHGTFVKLPCVADVGREEISEKYHQIFEQLGELSAEFRKDIEDGRIDLKEKREINEMVDRIHQTLDGLRALTFKVYCKDTAEEERSNKKRGAK